MRSIRLFWFSAILTLVTSTTLYAAEPLSAQEIAQRLFDVNRGWGNLEANVRMELQRGSATAVREMQMKMIELENAGESDLLRVLQPADLSGTVLLTTTHDAGADEQWLYLPAIKRAKRIAMESKGGAFLSSEFSFENLSPFQVRKYTYRRLPDEIYSGEACYVLESTPVGSSSVYGKLINWITQSDYRLLKTQFFEKNNLLEKTLYIERHEKYREKYWKPVRLKMVSSKTDAVTLTVWSDLSYDAHRDLREFDPTNLKRAGF